MSMGDDKKYRLYTYAVSPLDDVLGAISTMIVDCYRRWINKGLSYVSRSVVS